MRSNGGVQPAVVSSWFDAILGPADGGSAVAGEQESRWQLARWLLASLGPEMVLGSLVLIGASVQLYLQLHGRPLGDWSDGVLLALILMMALPLGVLSLNSTLLKYRFQQVVPALDQAVSLHLRLDQWLTEFGLVEIEPGVTSARAAAEARGTQATGASETDVVSFVESLRAPGAPQLPSRAAGIA